ncbi:energy-coupling factor transporter transmembrane component T family protein [Agrococcus jejuensis]|uniref:Energy-coupling factor transport system permease protein n=1 Tax=Agrococcus jejuensis TaxID=399736 RepID=A0A1G8GN11_9MICO|nr:energy-coupling factor transporter transmembrane component T [Agrococcus jejuensis]SDH95696.1 energy-coupling factor transport system permease protein [Agrococcus jejuensis]
MIGTRRVAPPTHLDRVNPVTPFLAAIVLSLPLLVTIDVVSASVALVLGIAGLLAAGLRPGTIVRRTWPVLVAAPLSGISMLLYAQPAGRIHLRVWLAVISDDSIALAVAIVVRVLAIGVPTLAILAGIDATRLGDGLAQVLRLPARFVLAALAGIRLFGVLREDWDALAAARRARGLGDGGRIRRWLGMAFTVLVIAVRRGGRLATAMEARGFGHGERTWARESRLGRADAVLLGAAVLIVVAALGAAIATGSFRLVGT